jgi:D-alanyl-D-alanine carboxypeptidase (penicillin-binding protein 5/6)
MLMKYRKYRKPTLKRNLLIFIVIAAISGYGYFALTTPLPDLKPSPSHYLPNIQTTAALTWPTSGESAAGVFGTNILNSHGSQTPVPTASTAKLLTALSVLRIKPLVLGTQGPLITLGPADVAFYNKYVAEDGSVVPVTAGEQISEYNMLETMMLPSANNMADSLAAWAFGTLNAYDVYANNYAQQLGLTKTHIGSDASGFNPDTTSTATNLVVLGEAALKNPVLAQIVAQKSATGIPIVGTVKNVNQLIGVDNIIGIKTGNSNQAGGVFISASKTTIAGQDVTIITALAKANTLYDAMYNSIPLITSAQVNFADSTAVKSGTTVATYKLPWGGSVGVTSENSVKTESWKGSPVKVSLNLHTISATSKAKQMVGLVTAQKTPFSGTQVSSLLLKVSIPQPPFWWRLIHPKGIFVSKS